MQPRGLTPSACAELKHNDLGWVRNACGVGHEECPKVFNRFLAAYSPKLCGCKAQGPIPVASTLLYLALMWAAGAAMRVHPLGRRLLYELKHFVLLLPRPHRITRRMTRGIIPRHGSTTSSYSPREGRCSPSRRANAPQKAVYCGGMASA